MNVENQTTCPPQRVILIQADDLGFDDIAYNGNPLIDTPNLDKLADQSIHCTDFTVNPVCAPSRATLLTGRHFLRTGVSHVHGGKDFLAKNEETLGDIFSANGWITAMYGKWHSGNIPGYFPWERGFKDAYMSNLYRHQNAGGKLNGKPIEHHCWSDKAIFDYAIECLETNKDKKLFLYISTMTPHEPLEAPQEIVQIYREKGLSDALSTLYAMVTYLDQQLGRLMKFLDESRMTENTLLLFISDNGPAINKGILSDEDRRIRKTSIRKGWKGDLYENGVKSPFFMQWPARYPAEEIATPIDQVDLFPTLAEWCNLERASDKLPLDGKSLVNLFDHTAPVKSLLSPIYNYAHPGWISSPWEYNATGLPGEYNPVTPEQKNAMQVNNQPLSIREGKYKLLVNADSPTAGGIVSGTSILVDLDNDQGEAVDVAAEHPEVYTRLRKKLVLWLETIKQEPSSFGHPVITVNGDTVFPAKLASSVSPTLQNTVSGLQGWCKDGQFVAYQLYVNKAGRYKIDYSWQNSSAYNMKFITSIDGHISNENLNLPRGNTTLRLTCSLITDKPEDENKTLLRLQMITLNHHKE